ncbi:MAG: tRNA guanosine(34) transglycosylase Tgt [Patescibacteria group bacterium]
MSIIHAKPYRVMASSKKSKARLGLLSTAHGQVTTPVFMPIATRGAVKTLRPDEIRGTGAQLILSNTYHLWQRPGLPVIKKAGGLHAFMGWSGSILTDSGGYQVFSLARSRKITERGVQFTSDIDGQKYLLTPEKAIDIQHALGSDIIMSLDECPPYPSTHAYAERSLAMTTRWAIRCKTRNLEFRTRNSELGTGNLGQGTWNSELGTMNRGKDLKFSVQSSRLLFGIVQGSVYQDLRERSARQLVQLELDGYAIGGLAVGEPTEKMYQAIDWVEPILPENKPRYLMGVGYPEQIIEAVKRGIDMFDCVLPTRNARHGSLFNFKNKTSKIKFWGKKFYDEMLIKQSRYAASGPGLRLLYVPAFFTRVPAPPVHDWGSAGSAISDHP